MTKICYDNDLLQEVCDRDKCIIDFDKIEKYNREIKVEFRCNCGIEYSRTFRLLYEVGAFCKICTKNKRKEKVKQTCIERYGVEFPSQSQEFKERVKQTCIEKYGVEYALQSQEVKDKSKQTCIERYGFENPSQSQEIKNKKTKTSLNNYGVEYPMQSQEVRDKNKLTCIEKYGVEYASQSYEVRDKLKTNCLTKELLEKICSRDKCIIDFDKLEKCNRDTEINFICNCGIEYSKTFRQIYDVSGGYCKKCTENRRQEKVKKTCLDRYGVENTLINLDNIRYTKELLENICSRDKCIIYFDKIEKYNRETNIDFICNCGITYNKTFRQLYELSYGFCKKCTENRRIDMVKQTCLDRYGVEYASQSQETKDKSKQTCIEKYGVEYSLQSQEVRNKSKQTCIEKYGVENPFQSQEIKDKIKTTCLIKYGVEYASQLDKFKEKVKQTCIEKYGVEYLMHSKEFKDKSIKTCLDKYGVEHPSQLQDFQDKIKQTRLDKYGVEYSLQSQEIKDKFKQTCLLNNGTEYPMQSQEVRNKSKQTCLLNNGFEYPTQTEKCKKTCIKKYGVEYSLQSQEVKDKSKKTCLDKYGVEHVSQSYEFKEIVKQTCLDKYGVEYPMQFGEVAEYQLQNSYKLKEFNFPCGNTILVQGYEPLLLKNLVEEGYTYKDIIVKRTEVPEIWYEKDNKKHRYYCDVYIPKINTIYEVKSTWTYKKDIDKINLTKQSCIDAGYLFELYVYDGKGIRQEI